MGRFPDVPHIFGRDFKNTILSFLLNGKTLDVLG